MTRRVPSKHCNKIAARERDQSVLPRLVFLLACGLVLASGFVYAGGRHFAAIRLGYQTEKLRGVRDELAQEQRRLLLEREAAASPARLEVAARRLGLQPLQAEQIDPLERLTRRLGAKDSAKLSKSTASDQLSAGSREAKLTTKPEDKRSVNRTRKQKN